ncbi:hypothetical protein [Listeria seeligeri]|uniref:hypothetical protein n=1 Tax=Listeria seeligeri TaxID=1640 RepID=UPI001EF19600|nr:hypothetical protein [Listeria seeligeri]
MSRFNSILARWEAVGTKPPESTIENGWLAGTKPPADWFNWYFNSTYQALKEIQELVALNADLISHTSNSSNPHQVTKTQIGLSAVDNVKQATKTAFDAHVASKENPHQVTKTQIGLSNVTNVEASSKAEFDTHTKNISNPHQVTKAQIGLNAVENYPLSTKELAEAGSSSAHYMTPSTTKQAIDKIGGDLAAQAREEAIRASLSKNGDTAAGELISSNNRSFTINCGTLRHYIGNQNDGTAIRIYFSTDAGGWTDYLDIIVGGESVTSADGRFQLNKVTNANTYVTGTVPATYKNTKSVINGIEKLANNTISTINVLEIGRVGDRAYIKDKNSVEYLAEFNKHKSDLSNPHEVSKSQIGLGNVENFGIATQDEAITGTAIDKLMTPASTLEAIKERFKTQNILFEGAAWPAASTYTFAKGQKISDQNQGIVLIWSDYDVFTNGTPSVANNYNFDFTFIPKFFVEKHPGANLNVPVATNINSTTAFITIKTLYLTNTTFAGNDSNNTGVNATDAILRYIVGV